jgi:hypothetical protein
LSFPEEFCCLDIASRYGVLNLTELTDMTRAIRLG